MENKQEEHSESLFAFDDSGRKDAAQPETAVTSGGSALAVGTVPGADADAVSAGADGEADRSYRPLLSPRINDPGKHNLSYGKYLKELRLLNHFTMEQIAEETKIRSTYLEALESEDLDSLPPLTYILGYVRKLCALYRIPSERADELTAELRGELEYELPEDMEKSIVDHEVSEENERKLRQLTIVFCGGAALIVALLIAGGILLWTGLRNRAAVASAPEPVVAAAASVPTAAPVRKTDEKTFDVLRIQPESKLTPTLLPR